MTSLARDAFWALVGLSLEAVVIVYLVARKVAAWAALSAVLAVGIWVVLIARRVCRG